MTNTEVLNCEATVEDVFSDDLPFPASESEMNVVTLVQLKLKKSNSRRLINAIISNNRDVIMEEVGDSFVLTAPYIKVTREVAEDIIGTMTDARWRMLFMNRTGEVTSFNNAEFVLGNPLPEVVDEPERIEYTQMNVRIPKELKEQMDELRELLGSDYSQNLFVTDALKEFIASIKSNIA